MFINAWDFLLVVSRAAVYLGVAGAIGGVFFLLVFTHISPPHRLWRYLRCSCVLGLTGASLYFFARVGELGAGFDTALLSIVADSAIGDASKLQVGGFVTILVASIAIRQRATWTRRLAGTALLLGGIILLWSFSRAGHMAEQDWLARLALMLHVLAMSLWLGSFYPLLESLRTAEPELARHNLKLFGDLGTGIVGLLLVCGLWLSLVLLPDFTSLLTTGHGRALSVKLSLVCLLLLLAAANKWIWVPRLFSAHTAGSKLVTSIRIEMVVAMVILVTTAVLANLVGPHH